METMTIKMLIFLMILAKSEAIVTDLCTAVAERYGSKGFQVRGKLPKAYTKVGERSKDEVNVHGKWNQDPDRPLRNISLFLRLFRGGSILPGILMHIHWHHQLDALSHRQ